MIDVLLIGLTGYMMKEELKFDASKLSISPMCEIAVKLGEGFHNNAKKIAGESVNQYTIGWGSTSANHSNIGPNTTLPTSVLQKMLEQDLKVREMFIKTTLAGVKLTQGQFDALVSVKYNANGLLTSKSPSFNKFIRQGEYEKARQELDFWEDAGHINHKGLAKRRMLEHCLWLGLPLPNKAEYDKYFGERALEFARTKDTALLRIP